MDKIMQKELYAALLKVQAMAMEYRRTGKPERGFVTMNGICSHVEDLMPGRFPGSVRRMLREMMEEWPEYSGRASYPVPSPEGFEGDAVDAYIAITLPKWSGEYGDSRMRLLDWLIEQSKG